MRACYRYIATADKKANVNYLGPASDEEIARYLSSIHVFNFTENSENKFGVPGSGLGT